MANTFAKWLEDTVFANETSVVNMYAVVEDARKALGFHTPDDNEIIMSQATYVTQQFRKFVSTIKSAVLETAEDCGPEKLQASLIEQMHDLDTFPKDERLALYYTVRDGWLTGVINLIGQYIMTDGEIANANEANYIEEE